MGREDVNACVSFSKVGNGVLGWAGEGWGAGSRFGRSPSPFRNFSAWSRHCFTSFSLMSLVGSEGSLDCLLTASQKTWHLPVPYIGTLISNLSSHIKEARILTLQMSLQVPSLTSSHYLFLHGLRKLKGPLESNLSGIELKLLRPEKEMTANSC